MAETHPDYNNQNRNSVNDHGETEMMEAQIQEANKEASRDPQGKTDRFSDTIKELKVQNSRLRKLLKDLSDKLTYALEKQKTKMIYSNTNANLKPVTPQEEKLLKELDDLHKQTAAYQRELKQLHQKFDKSSNTDKFLILQDKLIEKDNEHKAITNEKNTLEKILRDKQGMLDAAKKEFEPDAAKKQLTEQLRLLRDKYKDFVKVGNSDPSQKRNQYIIDLEDKFRAICEKTGYNPHDEQIHKGPKWDPRKMDDSKRKKKTMDMEWKPGQQEEPEDPNLALSYSEANYNQLRQYLLQLKTEDKTQQDTYKKQLTELKEKYTSVASERTALEKQYTEREKQSNVLAAKVRELSRLARSSAILPPMQEDELRIKSLPSKSNQFRVGDSMLKSTVLYKGYRKDERGSGKYSNDFNDREKIQDKKVRISSISVWYDGAKVTGILAKYRTSDGKEFDGGQHLVEPTQVTPVVFAVGADDYIKEISGFIERRDDQFECLILTSFKGQTQKVGQPGKEGKLFKFDINEMEYPACIFGSLKEGKGSWISKLGVFIASEEIEERILDATSNNGSQTGNVPLSKSQQLPQLGNNNKTPGSQSQQNIKPMLVPTNQQPVEVEKKTPKTGKQ